MLNMRKLCGRTIQQQDAGEATLFLLFIYMSFRRERPTMLTWQPLSNFATGASEPSLNDQDSD